MKSRTVKQDLVDSGRARTGNPVKPIRRSKNSEQSSRGNRQVQVRSGELVDHKVCWSCRVFVPKCSPPLKLSRTKRLGIKQTIYGFNLATNWIICLELDNQQNYSNYYIVSIGSTKNTLRRSCLLHNHPQTQKPVTVDQFLECRALFMPG